MGDPWYESTKKALHDNIHGSIIVRGKVILRGAEHSVAKRKILRRVRGQ